MRKKVNIIVAVAENGVIGRNGKLPWEKLRADMKRFKDITAGNPVVMGRKTWESLPQKPLPDRQNIVLSDKTKELDGCTVCTSLGKAISIADTDEVFIIGGAGLYEEALPRADKIYMTIVRGCPKGDVKFPFPESPEGKAVYDVYHMPPAWHCSYQEDTRQSHEDEFACIFTEWVRTDT